MSPQPWLRDGHDVALVEETVSRDRFPLQIRRQAEPGTWKKRATERLLSLSFIHPATVIDEWRRPLSQTLRCMRQV